MKSLKKILSRKAVFLLFSENDGAYFYVNAFLRSIGKKVDYILTVPYAAKPPAASAVPSLPIEELARFDMEEIAVFAPRYETPYSYNADRQFRRFGMLHNHHFFHIEDLTGYPIKEDYRRQNAHAPWSMDGEFIRIYNTVRKNTLVDITRCYELKSLLMQTGHIEGDVLEVGVYHGGTGSLLAAYAAKLGKHIYLADTFKGFVNADAKYDRGVVNHQAAAPSYRPIAEELLTSNNASNYTILEGSFPENTGHLVERERFCFCHMDTDVYWAVRNPTEWIWDRLSVGGILVYDDYGFNAFEGTTRYVDSIAGLEDRVFVYNMNGHGIIIKMK